MSAAVCRTAGFIPFTTLTALVALLIPAAGARGDAHRHAKPTVSTASQPTARPMGDVMLGTGDSLSGRVVDPTGKPVDGARVVLKRQGQVVATLMTDASGSFSLSGISPAIYQLQTAGTMRTFRVWRAEVAPPAAGTIAQLVVAEPTVRGQYGYGGSNVLALALGASGLAVGVIALGEAQDADDRAKRAESLAARMATYNWTSP